jgi:nucleotidyltransferase/DNA polymerase involved in DNA repair
MKQAIIAVAALPRLPTEVRGSAEDQRRGVVVDEGQGGGKKGKRPFALRSVSVLVDATAAARAEGVQPGMRVIDAQRFCPMIALDVIARARLEQELAVVAEVLLSCSPVVEPLPPATWSGLPMAAVALDLTGMVRPIPDILADVQAACARLGHRAAVVASPGTRLSFALARDLARETERGLLEVRPKDVPTALASLSVDALELPADLAASLHALGARTAADVARLLPLGGVERLGAATRPILEVLEARAAPLTGLAPPARLVEELELEHPLGALEPLLFVLQPLCQRLAVRAHARRQRVAEISLTLARKRGPPLALKIAFPAPLLDEKAMLRALQVRLERQALGGPVDVVLLEATGLARRGPEQLSLEPGARAEVRAEEALQSLLAEMAAELGDGRAGCLVVTDEPLPERMTRLAWPAPPPPPRPPAPERRRPRRSAALPSGVTSGGRFLAGWPWPLRLLDKPVRLGRELAVAKKEPFGVLEGEDRDDRPYARSYLVLTFADGRRALGLLDEELEEIWLHGWFD